MVAQEVNLTQGKSAAIGTDDREARPRFWIAAYTRPRSEKKAAEDLRKAMIETYVPVQTIERQWSDRRKKINVVVIPMVIFACIAKDDIPTVRQDPRILRILSYPGRREPAVIPEEQIRNLRLLLTKSDTPVEFTSHPFNLSDTVRVKAGNLEGLIGKVERLGPGKTKLVVSIDLLGGAMVEIASTDLEIHND